MWYLPCYFLVLMLHSVLKELKFKYHNYLDICFAIILFFVANLISNDNYIVIQRVMIGYFFFEVGFYYSQRRAKIICSIPLELLLTFIFILLSILNGMVSLVDMRMNNVILYALNGILGTYLLICFFRRINKLKNKYIMSISSFLQYLGRSTLIILCTHMFWIEIFRLVDYKIFNDVLKTFGYLEGPLFAIIIILCVLPTIPIIDKYLMKIT